MTEMQKEFCSGVAKLCEAANAPHLYRPIIKLWSLFENEDPNQNNTNQNGTNQNDTNQNESETKIIDGNMNNVTADQAKQNAAIWTKLAADLQAEEAAQKAAADAQQKADDVAAKTAATEKTAAVTMNDSIVDEQNENGTETNNG